MTLLINRLELVFYLVVSYLIGFLPFVGLPFLWLGTYFHELSHGVAALLSGGSIISLNLSVNGTGHCITSGGSLFLISISGYLGSALSGYILYKLSGLFKADVCRVIGSIICTSIFLVFILYASNLITYLILSLLFIYMLCVTSCLGNRYFNFFIKLTGISVLSESLLSPLILIFRSGNSDASNLAK